MCFFCWIQFNLIFVVDFFNHTVEQKKRRRVWLTKGDQLLIFAILRHLNPPTTRLSIKSYCFYPVFFSSTSLIALDRALYEPLRLEGEDKPRLLWFWLVKLNWAKRCITVLTCCSLAAHTHGVERYRISVFATYLQSI